MRICTVYKHLKEGGQEEEIDKVLVAILLYKSQGCLLNL